MRSTWVPLGCQAGQAADELAEATSNPFGQHPDAPIISSFPGLGEIAGARILAVIGAQPGQPLKTTAPSRPAT